MSNVDPTPAGDGGPRLPQLTEADLDPAQKELFEAIVGGRRAAAHGGSSGLLNDDGVLIGPFNPLLQMPEVGQRVQALGEAIRFSMDLPDHLLEIAILTVARHWEADFEWFAHARLARTAGVPEEIIEAIRTDEKIPFRDATEAIVHEMAAEVLSSGRLSDARYAEGLTHIGSRQLAELMTLVGYYCLVSINLNAFRAPLPAGVPAPFER